MYMFDFGDETASGWVDEPSLEHTYLKEGTYNASLTVRLEDGTSSDPVTVEVTVLPGDKASDQTVPGMRAPLVAMALLVGILLAARRRGSPVRGGGGG
jgi:PKD repeat protein